MELAQKRDVVVVIGGARSNNTHELVKTCAHFRARVHHVQTAGDLRADGFLRTTSLESRPELRHPIRSSLPLN